MPIMILAIGAFIGLFLGFLFWSSSERKESCISLGIGSFCLFWILCGLLHQKQEVVVTRHKVHTITDGIFSSQYIIVDKKSENVNSGFFFKDGQEIRRVLTKGAWGCGINFMGFEKIMYEADGVEK